MTAPLTYEFYLDPSETVRAIRQVSRGRPFAWTERAGWLVLFGLAALYLATGTPIQDLWALGLVALFLLALRWLTPSVQRWQLQRTYSETPSLRGAQVYQFTDTGLIITGGAASVTLGWDSFVKVDETREFLLLFYSKRCAYYLPKRVVHDERDRSALRTLLRGKLGARADGLQADEVRVAPA